uniref:3-dehydrosphinganine reductase n=1 Tax=Nelumbo nucifera TaxID=4432 RepID=A0A822YLY2_NELNU|nr:TPA_asm: hypothetical protein HUJ06_012451 [Nelumbo nucifera]
MADTSLLFLVLILLPPLALLLTLTILVRPRPVKIPIKGRHVFITGGSSGIGLALAHQAASEGARVSILARKADKLEEARNSIRLSTGIDVAVFSVDVRDSDAVQRAIDEADPIDILICNQGVFIPQELELQSLETVKFMIDVNLMGTFHLIKSALPNMKNRGDRRPASIAIMSSQAGQVGIYGYTAYSASKFGLRGLGEALQQEVIADNIHVSLIFPPDTETPGFLEETKTRPLLTSIIAASSGAMKADEVAKKALDGIKSGRFIVPCNLDGFLLSIATAGLSPQRSPLMAFIEVVSAGALRIGALFFQWNWYGSIARWHAQKTSAAGIGGIFRRRDGTINWSFSGLIGIASSTKAEIMSALTGIRIARDLSYQNIIIKRDSANTIKWLADPGSGPWALAHFLAEARDILSNLNAQLGWIPRELNSDADGLAKAGAHRDFLFSDSFLPT